MNSRDFSAALSTIAIFVMACLVPGIVLAIEEPEYEILEENGGIELRSYDEVILAETRVDTRRSRRLRSLRSAFQTVVSPSQRGDDPGENGGRARPPLTASPGGSLASDVGLESPLEGARIPRELDIALGLKASRCLDRALPVDDTGGGAAVELGARQQTEDLEIDAVPGNSHPPPHRVATAGRRARPPVEGLD